MSDRKFYATKVTITVLAEDEPWDGTLDWLKYDVTKGDYVGSGFTTEVTEVSAEQMTQLLIESGSDPSFFGLDESERPMHDVDGFDIGSYDPYGGEKHRYYEEN